MRALLLALPFATPLILANGEDPVIPPTIQSMLDAAMKAGNDADVSVIVKYARDADPASADKVMKIAADWRTKRSQTAQQKIRDASILSLVKGHAELGGYMSTGNAENTGVTAAVELKREGIEWRHTVKLQADYQKSLGVVTRERYFASYEPNWKFNSRAYLYGAAQFESDRFSGFDQRYSISTGIGYSAIKTPAMTVNLELGPAFRHSELTDHSEESDVGARGSFDMSWKLTRAITMTQNAAAYLQSQNSTVSTKSALVTKLFGPFSAQISYTMQYQSDPPVGTKTTDTTSRASLVIDF